MVFFGVVCRSCYDDDYARVYLLRARGVKTEDKHDGWNNFRTHPYHNETDIQAGKPPKNLRELLARQSVERVGIYNAAC
jgi:hypothetical protein